MLFQQLHGLPGHIAATAGPCRWAAAFDALHTVETGEDEVFRTQLLAVEVDFLEDVDHRRHHLVGEGEGAVVLGVAADLQDPFAQLGEGSGEVGGGGGLTDAAFAVDGDHQGFLLNVEGGVLVDLHTAFAICGTRQGRGHSATFTRGDGFIQHQKMCCGCVSPTNERSECPLSA